MMMMMMMITMSNTLNACNDKKSGETKPCDDDNGTSVATMTTMTTLTTLTLDLVMTKSTLALDLCRQRRHEMLLAIATTLPTMMATQLNN